MTFIVALLASFTLVIDSIDDEKWWGTYISNGLDQPYVNSEAYNLEKVDFGCATAPVMVSSKGRYIWSDRPYTLSATNGTVTLDSDYAELKIVKAGESLRDAFCAVAARHFTADGVMPPKEFFVKPQFNNWIELFINGSNQKSVDDYTAGIASSGYPCGVYMMDASYMPHLGSYEISVKKFPDFDGMITRAHAVADRVLVWNAHFVAIGSSDYEHLKYDPENGGRDFLCHRRDGNEPAVTKSWCGPNAVFDLTNPDVREYYVNTIKTFMAKHNVDGMKFDGGDCSFMYADGDIRFHEQWQRSTDYAHAYGKLIADNFPYSETRSCHNCGGRSLVLRLIDKKHTWQELRRLIPEVIAAGLCGYPFTIADMIGGGDCISYKKGHVIDQKLVVRSCQVQTLMPMMQFSLAPWRVLDERHNAICKRCVELHIKFAPYILALAEECAKSGEPMVRSMEYAYPHCGYEMVKEQFMLGDRYLVSPVVDENDCVEVKLPKGEWIDDLGEKHVGPKTLVLKSISLERLPYFERQ